MPRLDVPFFENRAKPDDPDCQGYCCQEVSLQSTLGYFEPDTYYSFDRMCEITGKLPDKAVWAFEYSIWLVDNGYEVKRMTTVDYPAFAKKGIDYIRKSYGDEIADWQLENSDVDGALEKVSEYLEKVQIVKRKPTVEDIREAMEDGWVAKVMVDSGVLNDLGKYVGHTVVVTDYGLGSVTFHDSGLPPVENRIETIEKFTEAMDSFGGEMDLIRPKA